MFRLIHAWSGSVPSDDKQATTSGAKCAVVDETCSCSTCDSPSVFGRKPTGNSTVAEREKVLFEDYDVCAYHIIVAKPPRNKTRRSFQQRRQLSSSLFVRPRTTTTITFIKRWRQKKWGQLPFHRRLPLFMHESLLKTNVYMPDAISWFSVCFISPYKEWLYGSMIVYKFVIKLSANKESGNKINFKRL